MIARVLAILVALLPTGVMAQMYDSVSVYASGGRSNQTWHGQADLQALHVELARALSPRTEVAVTIAPMSLWQARSWFGDQYGDGNERVQAISGSVAMRRTFNLDSPRFQWYAEASTGPMWAQKAVPAATSRFNFVTQAATGIILRPSARRPIIGGLRFMHISNAGYSERNPGLNVYGLFAGVKWRR